MISELLALLFMVMVPVAFPLFEGLKVTVRTADWPLDRVVPPGTPLTMNSELEVATPETVTFELPVFVRVEFCVLSFPSATSPKLRVAGFAVSGAVAGVDVLEAINPEQPARPSNSKRVAAARPTSTWATGVPSLAAAHEVAIVEFTSPTTKTRSGHCSTELVLVVLAGVHQHRVNCYFH